MALSIVMVSVRLGICLAPALYPLMWAQQQAPTVKVRTDLVEAMMRSEREPFAGNRSESGDKAATIRGMIQLGPLSPGFYELQITVRDPQTHDEAQRSVMFEIGR